MHDQFALAIREFLNEVSAAAADDIERAARDGEVTGTTLRLRITLSSDDAPLERVFETTIDLPPPETPESAAMF